MKRIRIGNDINIAWAIMREDGNPFDLSNGRVSLYLKNYVRKEEVKGFSVEGNVISWTFLGKNQRNTGNHSLEMVINEGADGMITTDACDFVCLVPCSCKTGGSDDDGVRTESIELATTLEYVASVGYDDTEIREAISGLNEDLAELTKTVEDLAKDLKNKQDTIESNEKVTAAALTDIDSRMKQAVATFEREDTAIKASLAEAQTAIADIQDNGATKAELTQVDTALRDEILSNERVTAAALNDLNGKIADLAESVIGALNTEV